MAGVQCVAMGGRSDDAMHLVTPPHAWNVAGFRVLGVTAPGGRRVAQLVPGLALFGVAIAVMVEARLGVSPWTVFHQGAAETFDVSIGTTVIVTGAVILLSTLR